MRYKHTLVISVLAHGLAFAGGIALPDLLDVFQGPMKKRSLGRAENDVPTVSVIWQERPALLVAPAVDSGLLRQALPSSQRRYGGLTKRAQQTSAFISDKHEPSASPSSPLTLTPSPNNLPPEYPEEVRQKGITGQMIIALSINNHGNVIDAKLESGFAVDPLLQKAALAAVRAWKFIYKDGTPGDDAIVRRFVPITFELTD
ncbi:MAG: energy transducer TonB [Alphaproteobacteria bacterium]|nr:energy transducer TonB [Alphaproteobacteria bacterium]